MDWKWLLDLWLAGYPEMLWVGGAGLVWWIMDYPDLPTDVEARKSLKTLALLIGAVVLWPVAVVVAVHVFLSVLFDAVWKGSGRL